MEQRPWFSRFWLPCGVLLLHLVVAVGGIACLLTGCGGPAVRLAASLLVILDYPCVWAVEWIGQNTPLLRGSTPPGVAFVLLAVMGGVFWFVAAAVVQYAFSSIGKTNLLAFWRECPHCGKGCRRNEVFCPKCGRETLDRRETRRDSVGVRSERTP